MNAELCQHFWRNLVSKWIKFGLGQMKKDSLSSTIEYLKAQGWGGGPFFSPWKESRALRIVFAIRFSQASRKKYASTDFS